MMGSNPIRMSLPIKGKPHIRITAFSRKDDIPSLTLTITCPACSGTKQLTVKAIEFDSWMLNRTLIQNALPTLTTSERESIISGYCEKCWETIFKEEKEEKDDTDN
jgi:hypothetical protein